MGIDDYFDIEEYVGELDELMDVEDELLEVEERPQKKKLADSTEELLLDEDFDEDDSVAA